MRLMIITALSALFALIGCQSSESVLLSLHVVTQDSYGAYELSAPCTQESISFLLNDEFLARDERFRALQDTFRTLFSVYQLLGGEDSLLFGEFLATLDTVRVNFRNEQERLKREYGGGVVGSPLLVQAVKELLVVHSDAEAQLRDYEFRRDAMTLLFRLYQEEPTRWDRRYQSI